MAYYYPQNYQQPQQTQNNGVILVPSEAYVHSYPVAPGNCVTFKIEGQPIIMEKSMGFSQFDAPKVEKYRLVKEEPTVQAEPIVADYKADIEAIWAEINALKEKATPKKKKEVIPDDAE